MIINRYLCPSVSVFLTLTLAMAVPGLLRSRPCEGPALETAGTVDEAGLVTLEPEFRDEYFAENKKIMRRYENNNFFLIFSFNDSYFYIYRSNICKTFALPELDDGNGKQPPVACAAARRAEIEDMGSEAPGGLMSRPAARAASIRELEELVATLGAFRSTIAPSKSRFGLCLGSNSLLSKTLLSATRESGPKSRGFSEYFFDKSRKSRGSSEQLSLVLSSDSLVI